jgi:hypothetical protein
MCSTQQSSTFLALRIEDAPQQLHGRKLLNRNMLLLTPGNISNPRRMLT